MAPNLTIVMHISGLCKLIPKDPSIAFIVIKVISFIPVVTNLRVAFMCILFAGLKKGPIGTPTPLDHCVLELRPYLK
jgi:hypothetical protein